jgi:prepilin-type N-terminal cleavage/methylation domain-containing protein
MVCPAHACPACTGILPSGTATPVRRGFTLVEILIVVTILGVLAGVAVPRFRSPVRDAQEAALLFNLTEVRTTIERYRAQHDPAWPIVFGTQLTICTDANGLPGTRYGPYLRHGFPTNPVNDSALVKEVVAIPTTPDDTTGWVLVITTGEFRANVSGMAPSGKAYYDL